MFMLLLSEGKLGEWGQMSSNPSYFTQVHDAGFGPVKNRAGVYAAEDRGIIDTQHLDVTWTAWKIRAAGSSRI